MFFSARSAMKSVSRRPVSRLQVECLEDRTLLSGNPFAGSYQGTLTGTLHSTFGGDISDQVAVAFVVDSAGVVTVTAPLAFDGTDPLPGDADVDGHFTFTGSQSVNYPGLTNPVHVAYSFTGDIDVSPTGAVSVTGSGNLTATTTAFGLTFPVGTGEGTLSAHIVAAVTANPVDRLYDGTPFQLTSTATGLGGIPLAGSFVYAFFPESGPGLADAPTDAGKYSVISFFDSSDPNYADAESPVARFTILGITTTTTADNAVSAVGRSVILHATVDSSVPVDVGDVTFTVRNNSGKILGKAVVSPTVVDGDASATFVVPAKTPVGDYKVTAVYGHGTNLGTSTSAVSILTVGKPTTLAAHNARGAANQTIVLSALVKSGAALLGTGTVTFTVRDSLGNLVGSSVTSGKPFKGKATAKYLIPAGTAIGTYSITAVYNNPRPYLTSSDATKTLTVAAAATTTTMSSVSVPTSADAQDVLLSATVSSRFAIPVSEGTVTFTVRTAKGVVVGNPVTSATVAAGAASATFSLSAATVPGKYFVTAVYSGGVDFLGSSRRTTFFVTKLVVL